MSPEEKLAPLRQEIDTIDQRLLTLLAQRQALIINVAELKRGSGLNVHQPARFAQLLSRLTDEGRVLDLSPELIKTIWDAIHVESMRLQQEVLDKTQL